MAVIRKSITLTAQQDAFVKSLIEQGFYTNDSEYVRDIIRQDQERRRQRLNLNEALIEGLASGPSDSSLERIWEEALVEHRASK
uniref:type II toxin-antitoxin system ParD family antitoxin n=1 Tax=Algoriphagus sp. TaxID=1872435 RepID=UPI00404821DC